MRNENVTPQTAEPTKAGESTKDAAIRVIGIVFGIPTR